MRRLALLALPVLLATVLVACGDDDTSSSGGSAATTSPDRSTTAAGGEASGAAVVKFSDSEFGQILTDTEGNTLYLLSFDTTVVRARGEDRLGLVMLRIASPAAIGGWEARRRPDRFCRLARIHPIQICSG